MNVMAKAHEIARATRNQFNTYAKALSEALVEAHAIVRRAAGIVRVRLTVTTFKSEQGCLQKASVKTRMLRGTKVEVEAMISKAHRASGWMDQVRYTFIK